MSENAKALLEKYGVYIIFAALALFIGAQAITSSMQQSRGVAYKSISDKAQNLEDASLNLIEVSLKEYYLAKGYYPLDFERLVEHAQGDTKETLSLSKNSLDDFSYTRRGDEQAYKIIFTSKTGEKKTINGNYQEDYS